MRTHKRCPSCETVLPVDKFPKNRSTPDGLHCYCRACNRKKQASDRRQPWHRKMRRAYMKSERGKKAYDAYRERHPGKQYAHSRIQNLIAAGTITRPDTCEQCGNGGLIDSHHDDYAKPLVVRWLCRWCHQEWHRINGEGANADILPDGVGLMRQRKAAKAERIPKVAAMFAAGRTQSELARHFGVSTTTIRDDLKRARS